MITQIAFWILTFLGTFFILKRMHEKWDAEYKAFKLEQEEARQKSVRIFNGRNIVPIERHKGYVPIWNASTTYPTIVYIPPPPPITPMC